MFPGLSSFWKHGQETLFPGLSSFWKHGLEDNIPAMFPSFFDLWKTWLVNIVSINPVCVTQIVSPSLPTALANMARK
jgi:hypothetical protein